MVRNHQLVSRFRRSYQFAALAYERRNRKDTRKPMILVWFLILTFLSHPAARGNRNVKITTLGLPDHQTRSTDMPQAEMTAGLDLLECAGDAVPYTVIVPDDHPFVGHQP